MKLTKAQRVTRNMASTIEAQAARIATLTEALEKISRMHTVHDDKTNTFTLAMAHVVAAKALTHTDGGA